MAPHCPQEEELNRQIDHLKTELQRCHATSQSATATAATISELQQQLRAAHQNDHTAALQAQVSDLQTQLHAARQDNSQEQWAAQERRMMTEFLTLQTDLANALEEIKALRAKASHPPPAAPAPAKPVYNPVIA